MIKKHWPLLFTGLVIIISIILWITAASSADTGVGIFFGVVIFMFLFPLAGAVLGGWYGWTLKSPWKWLLAPAAYLGVVLYLVAVDLIVDTGYIDIGSYLSIGLFTGIACLAVEAITSVIAWLAHKGNRNME